MKNKTLFIAAAALFGVGFFLLANKKKGDEVKLAADLKAKELADSQQSPVTTGTQPGGNTGIVPPNLATPTFAALPVNNFTDQPMIVFLN